MKRRLLLVTAFAFSISVGLAQNHTEKPSDNEPKEIVFRSQAEKKAKIQKLENAIELRLSKGKTEAELKQLYTKLDLIKKAKVEPYEK